ncbi:hypothetical protein LWI29_036579 [Acer saccharum]|uniref:Uncharacterized protein n=1 Tax=Acer saccharum TaxID=4024 RepID=A0AA39TIT3_ACESA|nr:hypothetical protein LWI29_036579 [Acer saccharum]
MVAATVEPQALAHALTKACVESVVPSGLAPKSATLKVIGIAEDEVEKVIKRIANMRRQVINIANNVLTEDFRVKLGFVGKLVVNCNGRSGGLCLFWLDVVDVNLLSYSLFHIDVQVIAQWSLVFGNRVLWPSEGGTTSPRLDSPRKIECYVDSPLGLCIPTIPAPAPSRSPLCPPAHIPPSTRSTLVEMVARLARVRGSPNQAQRQTQPVSVVGPSQPVSPPPLTIAAARPIAIGRERLKSIHCTTERDTLKEEKILLEQKNQDMCIVVKALEAKVDASFGEGYFFASHGVAQALPPPFDLHSTLG